MAISWKIFRIANIVEMIISGAVIAFILFKPGGITTSKTDLVFFSAFCIIILIIEANCISNILMLRFFSLASIPGLSRKFFFWCITVLFLLIIAGLLCGVVAAIIELGDHSNLGYRQHTKSAIMILIWTTFIGLNGLYILISQVILFYKIRKNYRDNAAVILTGIGGSAL